jgi:hypothetical protein
LNARPKRRINWRWRNATHGYGELFIAVAVEGKREQLTEYFAQPLRGPLGQLWLLTKLVAGIGAAAEYEVNLIAQSCTCAGHARAGKCKHLDALNNLAHNGRL